MDEVGSKSHRKNGQSIDSFSTHLYNNNNSCTLDANTIANDNEPSIIRLTEAKFIKKSSLLSVISETATPFNDHLEFVYDYVCRVKSFVFKIGEYCRLKVKQLFGSRMSVREIQFERGLSKLESTMDVIRIFQAVRNVKLLTKIMLSKHQEFFLPILKHNVISSKPPEMID